MSHLHPFSVSAGHRQSSSNCSRVREAQIRARHLSPHPLMLPSRLFLFLSTLFSTVSLSSFSTSMTSVCGCVCCFIPAHIHPHRPSEVLVSMLGPWEAVPCLPGCFWGLLWHRYLSLPCMQAGGARQERQAGAAAAAPWSGPGFGVGEPLGGHGDRRVNCPWCGAIAGCPSAAPCCTNSGH